MFRGLRLRLTFLYLLVAAAFIGLMMAGTQRLLASYFEDTTDLALRYRMAQEFEQLGLPLPPELDSAVVRWSERRGQPTQVQPTPSPPMVSAAGEDEGEHDEEGESPATEAAPFGHEYVDEAYDGDLAAIYTLLLDDRGNLQSGSISSATTLTPDPASVTSALANGHDLRTIELGNGTRVRLLTYPIGGVGNQPAFLQLGRPLNDQQRLLNQLILTMAGLGGAILLVMSAGSWWLAGRSISPAEAAWRKQQTFIANAGHELRTPLTLLRANAEVALRATSRPDPRYTKLTDVLSESDHMAKLVDDLLLLSRLDSGAVELEISDLDVRQLLEDLRRQSEALAERHEVSLIIHDCPHVHVQADLVRLRQVLLILLDNALGHTPPGGEIRLSCGAEAGAARISVSDTGVGIREADLRHIFERFYHVERNGRTGSGLGLSIAKSLATAMGGDLELISSEGRGATAQLTLPAAAPPDGS